MIIFFLGYFIRGIKGFQLIHNKHLYFFHFNTLCCDPSVSKPATSRSLELLGIIWELSSLNSSQSPCAPTRLPQPNLTVSRKAALFYFWGCSKAFSPILESELWTEELQPLLCFNGHLSVPWRALRNHISQEISILSPTICGVPFHRCWPYWWFLKTI